MLNIIMHKLFLALAECINVSSSLIIRSLIKESFNVYIFKLDRN